MQILLYGDKDFTDGLNREILLLTLCFTNKTGRFAQEVIQQPTSLLI